MLFQVEKTAPCIKCIEVQEGVNRHSFLKQRIENIMNKLDQHLKNIEDNIGKRIHHTRSVLGVARADLARDIGVSGHQLFKYENGLNRISIGRLSLIALKFKKKIDYFYADIIEPESFENTNYSRSYLVLIKKLSKLKNKKQQQALSVLVDGLL